LPETDERARNDRKKAHEGAHPRKAEMKQGDEPGQNEPNSQQNLAGLLGYFHFFPPRLTEPRGLKSGLASPGCARTDVN